MADRASGGLVGFALATLAVAQIALLGLGYAIMLERPLFIPLRGIWFDAFARGEKFDEWRKLGPRWRVEHCPPGRPVILSRGYSGARLAARILRVAVRRGDDPALIALYGEDALCLVLTLHEITPL